MGLKEMLWGTPQEEAAGGTVRTLGYKRRLSPREQTAFSDAKRLSRRLFLRRTITLTAGGAATAVGLVTAFDSSQERETDEDVYNYYLSNFNALIGDDPFAREVYDFFVERRRSGKLVNGIVVAQEDGIVGENFYTVIVDPKKDSDSFKSLRSIAQYDHNSSPEKLSIVKYPIDPVWAGALLGHEAIHVYQDLKGIEEKRPSGFYLGEVDAHEFEFDLLNNATGGSFREVVRAEAKEIQSGNLRARLSEKNLYNLSQLFGPARSDLEDGIRIPAYLIALNFSAIDSEYPSHEERMSLKADYIEGIHTGRYPIMR